MCFCQPLYPEIRDRFFALAVSCGIFTIFTLYFTSTLRCNDSIDLEYSKKRVFDNMTSVTPITVVNDYSYKGHIL